MTVRNLDALFQPQQVLWIGPAQTAAELALLDKLRSSAVQRPFHDYPQGLPAGALPAASPGLAVITDAAHANAATLERVCAAGCRGLIWPLFTPPDRETLEVARRHILRILGPRSVGLAHPGAGFDLSALVQTPRKGSLALIVQSQSVAAAAADWAAGRDIGFSWIAVTGGECDVDVADLLDYAALDTETLTVAVEIGRIRGARKFMSAARACARSKPTVILQTRPADPESVGSDPVRSAAFARAGMVEVPNLPGLFDALAALQRLPVMLRPRVLTVANGAALCALSVDAVLRQGLQIAELPEALRRELLRQVPAARFRPGAIDIGDPAVTDTLELLQTVLAVADIDAVLFVRSPVAGHPHDPIAHALAQNRPSAKLLTVWLGLQSALVARRVSAEAGQATFTSPDAAARAVRYRWEYARNRELLTQTPPRIAAARLDPARVDLRLREHLGEGTGARADTALELLRAYGIESQSRIHREALELDVHLERHAELGMHLALRVKGQCAQPAVQAFVPLDTLLAARLISATGLDRASGITAEDLAASNKALVRIAQIAMDQPRVERLEVRLAVRDGRARASRDARLWLTPGPAPARERLALAPYPAAMQRRVSLRGGRERELRAVRPDDEPSVIALLQSLDAQTVRLRFFAHIRHFSHAMAARMTQIDYDRELALVAYAPDEPERLRAIATLISDPDGAEAEFALLVHQDDARCGLGRELLQALIQHAREQRIGRVWGEVLAENQPMLGLAQSLGFTRLQDPHDPTCRRVELRLDVPQLALPELDLGVGA